MISWDTKGGEKEEHREQQMTLYIAIGNKALQLYTKREKREFKYTNYIIICNSCC
jgi:hypothetical protein